MKYCKNCNHENEDGKKFCIKCGTPFDIEKTKEETQNEKKEWKKVMILAGVLLGSIGLGVLVFCSNNSQRLKKVLANEKWTDVRIIYEEMKEDGEQFKAEKLLEETAEDYQQQYESEELSYDDAVDKINEIKSIYGTAETVQNIERILSYIEELYQSRTAFQLAEKYWAEQDYANAISQYELVKEIDSNHQTAAERITEGKVLYKTAVIAEIEAKAQEENYDEVSRLVAEANVILGEDEEITALAEKYELACVEKELLAYEEALDYEGAIKYLKKYDQLVLGNSGLQTKLDGYKEKYREQLLAQAKAAYEESGYEAAITELQKGLHVISADNEIKEKIGQYTECAPVELQTLQVLSTDSSGSLNNGFKSETITDLYGNEYSGWC